MSDAVDSLEAVKIGEAVCKAVRKLIEDDELLADAMILTNTPGPSVECRTRKRVYRAEWQRFCRTLRDPKSPECIQEVATRCVNKIVREVKRRISRTRPNIRLYFITKDVAWCEVHNDGTAVVEMYYAVICHD